MKGKVLEKCEFVPQIMSTSIEAILTHCVQSSIRQFMYRNAIFVCERLCAEFPTEVNKQLLAGCYLHNNQAYSAYHILKGTQKPESRYLFALSCFQMDLLNEAETTLCSVNDPSAEVPNGAAGHYLLGLIYRYTDRRKKAVHHYKQALLIDPLLWSAYEELCVLGDAEAASEVFSEAAAICIQNQYSSGVQCNPDSVRIFGSVDASIRQIKNMHCNTQSDISGNHVVATMSEAASIQPVNNVSSNLSLYTTPPIVPQLPASGPPPFLRIRPQNPNSVNAEASLKPIGNSPIQAPRRKFVDEGKFRKISGKLFPDSGPRRSSRLAGDVTNTSTAILGGNGHNYVSKSLGSGKFGSVNFRSRKRQPCATESLDGTHTECLDDSQSNVIAPAPCSSQSVDTISLEHGGTHPIIMPPTNSSNHLSAILEMLGLFRTLGEAFRLSYMYKCQEALDVYLKLPKKQYNTAWVLTQVGKVYLELLDYLEADRVFSLACKVAPYYLDGMDIYSTVLYQLKEDMKLSYLAKELVSTDRLAPQSWCAMGNCFSLQKDHETALKIFQRAMQLNSRFTYAHTLCGHEYVVLEDFDSAIKCYEKALQIDDRHYNAWHGLGMIYFRQERFHFAEHHFRKAHLINSRSSVILTYLGRTLHALKRSVEALEMMDMAILADKSNPLPLYQKAKIAVSLGNFDEALKILEDLKEKTPCENSVYSLMGRIYKQLKIFDKAMFHFGIALDLKPSATDVASIKAAMEKLHVPDCLEEDV